EHKRAVRAADGLHSGFDLTTQVVHVSRCAHSYCTQIRLRANDHFGSANQSLGKWSVRNHDNTDQCGPSFLLPRYGVTGRAGRPRLRSLRSLSRTSTAPSPKPMTVNAISTQTAERWNRRMSQYA